MLKGIDLYIPLTQSRHSIRAVMLLAVMNRNPLRSCQLFLVGFFFFTSKLMLELTWPYFQTFHSIALLIIITNIYDVIFSYRLQKLLHF